MEIDPEDMTRFASEQPQTLAQYSVSDAVATYYLYMCYVHPFIFSLCNIIPLIPDEVLRKGLALFVKCCSWSNHPILISIMPNRLSINGEISFRAISSNPKRMLEAAFEALEAGVFRSDIPTKFKVDPKTAQSLLDELDEALRYTIEVENNASFDDIENYVEVSV